MSSALPTPTSLHADLSCHACRKLKRKCSKELPSCSLCSRVGRTCDYSTPSPDSPGRQSRPGTAQLQAAGLPDWSSTASRSSSARSPKFNAAWYIDSVSARGMEFDPTCELSWCDIPGIKTAAFTLQESQEIATRFFRTTHTWFPVVSAMRISRLLDRQSRSRLVEEADMTALLTAMTLLSNGPAALSYSAGEELYYSSLKVALAACESAGALTTTFLGAQVLLALYEAMHAIYPSAYFTVGHCSRTCLTLGLHDRRFATQLPSKVDTWTEVEERRRLWWATLLLDRVVNIRFSFRPLAVASIPPTEIIPADDTAWDQGELVINPLLVMSIEADTKVSGFARTCQAAHLLGRVYQHINEHTNPTDVEFHFQEAHRIHRAVGALLKIIRQQCDDFGADEGRYKLFTPLALCCSALLVLYDVHSCIEVDDTITGTGSDKGLRMEMQQVAIDGFNLVSLVVLDLAEEVWMAAEAKGLDAVSPFVLHALYESAGTWAWYARENGDEAHLAKLARLREVIAAVGQRWRIGGECDLCNLAATERMLTKAGIGDYLELLKDTEFHFRGGCTQ